jgi:hypothetical protein
MPGKEFIKFISPESEDRLRIRIIVEKGRVRDLTVQYEAKFGDAWHSIVRYDCAHVFLHRDLMSPKGLIEKQPLQFANLNDALQYAEQDIKDRWQWYRERYQKELKT